jgi:large subunit ribosomal protein L17
MRHRKHTFKIGKSGAHRKAMMANLITSLFTHGRIKTTVVKAKELRRWAEKMITCGKTGDLHNRRKAISVIRDIDAVRLLFDEIAPKFKERQGGYTRIVKLNTRKGDGAELCFIELVEEEIKTKAKGAPAKEAPAEAPVEDKAEEVVKETTEAPAEDKAEEVVEETTETETAEATEEDKAEEVAEAPAEEKAEEKKEKAE